MHAILSDVLFHTCNRAHAQATLAVSCALRIGITANAWCARACAACRVPGCRIEPIAQATVLRARGAMVSALATAAVVSSLHTFLNKSAARSCQDPAFTLAHELLSDFVVTEYDYLDSIERDPPRTTQKHTQYTQRHALQPGENLTCFIRSC